MKKFTEILIVDDSDLMRELTREVLKGLGTTYQVQEAMNGQQALEVLLACTSPPDLIILDIQMPVMNGIELLEELDSCNCLSSLLDHIVVITASNSSLLEKKVKDKGIKWFFEKPFSSQILQTVLPLNV